MLYDAISKDDALLLKKAESLGADIYDPKGKGLFFIRAIAYNATACLEHYLSKPDIVSKAQSLYAIGDYNDAVRNANRATIDLLARHNITIDTLNLFNHPDSCIYGFQKQFYLGLIRWSIPTSTENLHKAIDILKSYLAQLGTASSNISFTLLNENEFDLFLELKAHKEVELETDAACFRHAIAILLRSNDKRNARPDPVWDIILEQNVADYDNVFRSTSFSSLFKHIDFSDDRGDHRADLIINFIVKRQDNPFVQKLTTMVTAAALVNHKQNKQTLEALAPVLPTAPSEITASPFQLPEEALYNLMEASPTSTEPHEQMAAFLASTFSKDLIKACNIDVSIPEQCLSAASKKRKMIKKVIIYHLLNEHGLETILPLVKQLSYIDTCYELGYSPYELLPYLKGNKLITKVMKDIAN